MAKKKVIVGANQLLITDNGEVIKAKKLLNHSYKLLQWDNKYSAISVDNAEKVISKLYILGGAQGRTLTCGDNVSLLSSNQNTSIDIDKLVDTIQEAKVFRYHPIFGSKELSNLDIDFLAASLNNIQHKRPNSYLNQPIPLYLSTLNKNSLEKLINIIFKNGHIKHLDQTSKDLMIILLSKLGIYFDAQPKQSSDNITGSIKLRESKLRVNLNQTKKESVRLLDTLEKEEAIELTFNETNRAVLGSFLCQIN